MLSLLLGIVIFSFICTSVLIVPFINILYQIRFQRRAQVTKDALGKRTPIFDSYHRHKAGTPVGGGLLIIAMITLLFFFLFPLIRYLGVYVSSNYPLQDEINILFFTLISFGLLGLYDDILKMFQLKKNKFFGLRMKHKFVIQWILALIIGSLLYFNLSIDIVNIPLLGVFELGWWYIPFAALVIVSFTNAVNITDGLDGLAGGVMLIALFAFWVLSASILDTPLSLFIALWIGALIAFLYFNIPPARIWMGDVGALAFGATFAVIGLLLGKVAALVIIGGIFVFEIFTSVVQLLSKSVLGRKVFPVAPFHLWLQLIGWEEPKIVIRFWLAAMMLAIFGVWLALLQF